MKKGVLKILQNSQENTCARVSFLIKLQASGLFFFIYFLLFFNWDSLHARLKSHYEAWSYKKRSTKKITGYRKSV